MKYKFFGWDSMMKKLCHVMWKIVLTIEKEFLTYFLASFFFFLNNVAVVVNGFDINGIFLKF